MVLPVKSKVPLGLLRALVVDDDEFMRDLSCEMLREIGVLSVSVAKNGPDGLNRLDHGNAQPNVILVDLHMPGGDGFQFMQAIADRNYQGGIILMSGQKASILHSAHLLAQLHRLHILAALEKPVNKSQLRQAIDKIL